MLAHNSLPHQLQCHLCDMTYVIRPDGSYVPIRTRLPGSSWQSAHPWPRISSRYASHLIRYLRYGSVYSLLWVFLFLLCINQTISLGRWLIDGEGLDVPEEHDENRKIEMEPTVLSQEINDLLMNLSNRQSWNISTRDPPIIQALVKVVWRQNETFRDILNGLQQEELFWKT